MGILCWKRLCYPVCSAAGKGGFSLLCQPCSFLKAVWEGGKISPKCLVRTNFSGSRSCMVWSCSRELLTELYFSWVCGPYFVASPLLLGWYVWRSPLRFPGFLLFVFRLWTPTFRERKRSRKGSCVKTTFILLWYIFFFFSKLIIVFCSHNSAVLCHCGRCGRQMLADCSPNILHSHWLWDMSA